MAGHSGDADADPPAPAPPGARTQDGASFAAAGIVLTGRVHDPDGHATVAAEQAVADELPLTALTVEKVAAQLRCTPAQVRVLLSQAALTVLPGTDRVPAWQVVDGRLVPGLARALLDAGTLHPLTVAGLMTRPSVDLVIDGHQVSPVAWLLAGGDPDVVAGLVSGMTWR